MGSTWLLRSFPKGIGIISLLALFLSLFLSPTSLLYFPEHFPTNFFDPNLVSQKRRWYFDLHLSDSLFTYLFGCAGSSLLHTGFALVGVSGAPP